MGGSPDDGFKRQSTESGAIINAMNFILSKRASERSSSPLTPKKQKKRIKRKQRKALKETIY